VRKVVQKFCDPAALPTSVRSRIIVSNRCKEGTTLRSRPFAAPNANESCVHLQHVGRFIILSTGRVAHWRTCLPSGSQ